MHHVEKSLEQALDRPTTWIHAHQHTAEYTRDNETVARLAHVHQFIVRAERDRVWRLTIRHRVGRLLQSDHLSVRKLAAVVHERHGADRGTDVARAGRWLIDLTAVDPDLHGVVAGEAAEKGSVHVGDDGGGSDDKTFDTDKFVLRVGNF
ncbi:hypothetical protein BGW80DRAFT_1335609 [Lactifluus volemus]|nr:hypothetical protein BGW80DRAFT_1335609 [Lactifluus volemus]